MDQISSIAGLATDLSTQKTLNEMGVLVAKKAQDSQRDIGAQLVALLDPNVGSQLNVAA